MRYWVFIPLLVIMDQVSKYFLEITRNTGAAFGILQGQNLFLILISLIALGFFILYYKKYQIASMFVISGIIGNLIDRIFLGYVRDFIDLRFWPVFNLADSFMVVGIGLLVWIIFKKN